MYNHSNYPNYCVNMNTKDCINIYIDHSNLFHSARNIDLQVDLRKLITLLAHQRPIGRIEWFGGVADSISEQQHRYLDSISQIRNMHMYTSPVQTRTVKCHNCNHGVLVPREKTADGDLMTEMVDAAHLGYYDTAILVAGDADYTRAVRKVQRLGLRVEIAGFVNSMAPALEALSSTPVIWFDDHCDELMTAKQIATLSGNLDMAA